MPGQTGTGHQYEVLLKEKGELQNEMEEFKRVNIDQRKINNELRTAE